MLIYVLLLENKQFTSYLDYKYEGHPSAISLHGIYIMHTDKNNIPPIYRCCSIKILKLQIAKI